MSKIKKILSFGAPEFNSGVASALYSEGRGIWSRARGFLSYADIDEYSGSGVLRPGDTGTEIGDGTVVDGIEAGTQDPSSGYTFLMGDTGHFYRVDTSNNVTDLRSGTPITSPSDGMEIYQPQGGTKYLYYFQDNQIGRWDLAGTYATGWTDNHFTGLSSNVHYTHPFFGSVYYTNLSTIGRIYDNTGTAANNTNVLDFPSNYVANSLTDDGTYLVIGISSTNFYNTGINDTKILFWDTFSPSWNKEYSLPEGFLYALKKVGNKIYAFGSFGLYVLNYNSEPTLVAPFTPDDPPTKQTDVAVLGNSVYWFSYNGDDEAFVSSFGDRWGMQPSLQQPFRLTAIGEFIMPLNDVELLVSQNNELYLFDYTATGSIANYTIYSKSFDLNGRYKIKKVVLTFSTALVNGDSVEIYLREGGQGSSWGTASYATHGSVYRVELSSPNNITQVYDYEHSFIDYTLTIYGVPKFRRIDIYGEQLDDT